MYKTLAIYGTNKALYVSIQPKLDIVLKLVTISTSPGIIIDARKIANIKSLPLNSKLAKAKAERIAIITVEIILNTVTIIVLIKYLTNGAILNAIV